MHRYQQLVRPAGPKGHKARRKMNPLCRDPERRCPSWGMGGEVEWLKGKEHVPASENMCPENMCPGTCREPCAEAWGGGDDGGGGDGAGKMDR